MAIVAFFIGQKYTQLSRPKSPQKTASAMMVYCKNMYQCIMCIFRLVFASRNVTAGLSSNRLTVNRSKDRFRAIDSATSEARGHSRAFSPADTTDYVHRIGEASEARFALAASVARCY